MSGREFQARQQHKPDILILELDIEPNQTATQATIDQLIC